MNMKTLPDFPEYTVSRAGAVIGQRGARLRTSATPDGYTRVWLCRYGEARSYYVHRLVLAAFVGPCPDGMECNHKNGVRDDNRLVNLEWITKSENKRHAYRELGLQARRGEAHPMAKLTRAEARLIYQAHLRNIPGKWLAEWFNVSAATVSRIGCGLQWAGVV